MHVFETLLDVLPANSCMFTSVRIFAFCMPVYRGIDYRGHKHVMWCRAKGNSGRNVADFSWIPMMNEGTHTALMAMGVICIQRATTRAPLGQRPVPACA